MLLTVEQAAKEAQVSPDTIERRIAEGRLVAANYGTAKRKSWRITPEALAAMKPPVQMPEPTPQLPSRRGRRPRASSPESVHRFLPDASA